MTKELMMLAIGCDHTGIDLKAIVIKHLESNGFKIKDFGTDSTASCDYPLIAKDVCHSVIEKVCDKGILICGTGVGMSIAANKIKGIRAVVCSDPFSAKASRAHNNANILSIGARVVGPELAKMIIDEWLNTDFDGDRHQRRLDLITDLENDN